MAVLGALQPAGGLARRPLRGPPHHAPGGWFVYRRHGAHGWHDPPMAFLSLLRHPPGYPDDDLSGAAGNRGGGLVQDSDRLSDGHSASLPGSQHSSGHSSGLGAIHALWLGLDVLGSWPGGWCPAALAAAAVSR